MNADDTPDIPLLGDPEIRGDIAERDGMVWASHGDDFEPDSHGRLLMPEQWVDDAVRGALAQYYDDIVDAVKAELRERTEELKGG